MRPPTEGPAWRPPRPEGPPAHIEVVPSPEIERLAHAIAAGDSAALGRFWATAAKRGTPLLEPDSRGDPRFRTVTFPWRDPAAAGQVMLGINRLSEPANLARTLMERLAGTDLWHRSIRMRSDWRASYQVAPMDVLEGVTDEERWLAFTRLGVSDPLCVARMQSRWTGAMTAAECSIVELPDAPRQPWVEPRRGVPAGRVEGHPFASRVFGNERAVWVYTPADYDRARAGGYAFLVMFDGEAWEDVASTLDNLVADGAIPPIVALMPESLGVPTRMRELGLDPRLLAFLTQELLPWAAGRWRLTADPQATVIAGRSMGGLAAAFAGLRAPGRFGNVLSQSGSFWFRRGSEFDLEAEMLTREFALSRRVDVRFYLEVGLQESLMLAPNRHLRDVLNARGYNVAYHEFNGGHDPACWRGSFADGLIALIGAKKTPPG